MSLCLAERVDWFMCVCVLTGFVTDCVTGCVSDCVVVAGFVVQLLEHKDYIVRKLASTLLAQLDSDQLVLWVPALLSLLKHPEEKVQAAACEVPSLASGCVSGHACVFMPVPLLLLVVLVIMPVCVHACASLASGCVGGHACVCVDASFFLSSFVCVHACVCSCLCLSCFWLC